MSEVPLHLDRRGEARGGMRETAHSAHTSQSKPDSGLSLSHFQYESLQNLLSCSLFTRKRDRHVQG